MDINRLIDSMSREEKITLVSGSDQWHTAPIGRLGIPAIMLADGPHGLRKQDVDGDHLGIGESVSATCFPPAATSANSWNRELLFAMGRAIGKEALHAGVSVVLGPGINIKRSPLCGRNFEYFSEDPFLTGELALAWIQGVQVQGVGASLKHYAANNQEKWRMLNDSLVDERALREIYLAGFEKAVKEGQPWTVMAAYNRLNGTYACENPRLLDSILRQEWGFDGLVLSDWGAVNDPSLSVKAGLDLEMPASYGVSAKKLSGDVTAGRLKETQLNRCVRRVLELVAKAEAARGDHCCDFEQHHRLARRIAAESAVLLKNKSGILPLREGQSIAVIGEFARHPRYQGTGSSLINPTKLDTVVDALKIEDVEFHFSPGYTLDTDEVDPALIDEACSVAEDADVALVFVGLTDRYESEGYDRAHLDLPPNHNELISSVAKVNPNVVVVLSAGAPVTMPWVDEVAAVLHTYLGGQAGAGATVDLLFGKENPSGKLAESYPLSLEDYLPIEFFAYDRFQTEYRESIFVGYRYYDAADKEVLFPFGYGLSYTRFSYEDLWLSSTQFRDTDSLTVKCSIRNIGTRAGAEIVQLYVGRDNSPLYRAPRELKGFAKVYLHPGEAKTVEFVLNKRSFAYYNVDVRDWHVEPGEYRIEIGSSSRDLHLVTTVDVEATDADIQVPNYRQSAPAYYHLADPSTRITQAQFAIVYGRAFPEKDFSEGLFHDNSTLEDLQQTRIGRLVVRFAKKFLWKMTGATDENDPLWLMTWTMTLEMPLRSVAALSGGTIPDRLVKGVIAWANGE
ncbi:MAG: glycosyl hydrolase, partial [Firmicutes bacterium]|nr:glycosyl hydrolase [Bacillota bacterium]